MNLCASRSIDLSFFSSYCAHIKEEKNGKKLKKNINKTTSAQMYWPSKKKVVARFTVIIFFYLIAVIVFSNIQIAVVIGLVSLQLLLKLLHFLL